MTALPDGTNHQIDLDNPDNLGAQSTDNGIVPNLKWRFSDSKTRIFNGGWVREQVIADLPASTDLSAAQLHLTKGSYRELHWHSVVSTETPDSHRFPPARGRWGELRWGADHPW